MPDSYDQYVSHQFIELPKHAIHVEEEEETYHKACSKVVILTATKQKHFSDFPSWPEHLRFRA